MQGAALGCVRRSGGGLQEAPTHSGRVRRRRGGVAVGVDTHRSSHWMVKLAVYAELADAITRIEFAQLFPLKISKIDFVMVQQRFELGRENMNCFSMTVTATKTFARHNRPFLS